VNVCRCSVLADVNLSNNSFSDVPEILCLCTTITHLDLSCNALVKLPVDLCKVYFVMQNMKEKEKEKENEEEAVLKEKGKEKERERKVNVNVNLQLNEMTWLSIAQNKFTSLPGKMDLIELQRFREIKRVRE